MTDKLTVRVTGKIEERDYTRAQWLHLRPRPIMALLGAVIVVLLLAGGVVQITGWLQGSATASDAMMLPFLSSLILLYRAEAEVGRLTA